MAEERDSLSWLPGGLLVLGVFMVTAGVLTDGPDRVGGIVFGVLSLAAAGAILYRRAYDARAAKSKDEASDAGAGADQPRD